MRAAALFALISLGLLDPGILWADARAAVTAPQCRPWRRAQRCEPRIASWRLQSTSRRQRPFTASRTAAGWTGQI